jgi:hypothetical protein
MGMCALSVRDGVRVCVNEPVRVGRRVCVNVAVCVRVCEIARDDATTPEAVEPCLTAGADACAYRTCTCRSQPRQGKNVSRNVLLHCVTVARHPATHHLRSRVSVGRAARRHPRADLGFLSEY